MTLGLCFGPLGIMDHLGPCNCESVIMSVCLYGFSGVIYSYAAGSPDDKVWPIAYTFLGAGGALAAANGATMLIGWRSNLRKKQILPILYAETVVCNIVLLGVLSKIDKLNLGGSLFVAGATALDLCAALCCGLRARRSLAQVEQSPNRDIEAGNPQ